MLDKEHTRIWRKSRLAARLLVKVKAGRPLSGIQQKLAQTLSADESVTDRLIDQALFSLKGSHAKRQNSY